MPRSRAVQTASTPARASAEEASSDSIRACARGLRMKAASSAPSRARSSTKQPAPVSRAKSSRRGKARPTARSLGASAIAAILEDVALGGPDAVEVGSAVAAGRDQLVPDWGARRRADVDLGDRELRLAPRQRPENALAVRVGEDRRAEEVELARPSRLRRAGDEDLIEIRLEDGTMRLRAHAVGVRALRVE